MIDPYLRRMDGSEQYGYNYLVYVTFLTKPSIREILASGTPMVP